MGPGEGFVSPKRAPVMSPPLRVITYLGPSIPERWPTTPTGDADERRRSKTGHLGQAGARPGVAEPALVGTETKPGIDGGVARGESRATEIGTGTKTGHRRGSRVGSAPE